MVEVAGKIFKSKSGKGIVLRVFGPAGEETDDYYFTSVSSVHELLNGDKPYINLNKGDDDYTPKA